MKFEYTKKNASKKLKKIAELTWLINSSNSHSLIVWESFVGYIFEFKLFWLKITNLINLPALHLGYLKKVVKKTATL